VVEAATLSDNSKKIVFHLHNAEIIRFIGSLPRGYRSLVVESALVAYMATGSGRTMIDQLHSRKKDRQVVAAVHRQEKVEHVFQKLKGDFD
jgi:hypothetical protein